jgi:hypothetical protein
MSAVPLVPTSEVDLLEEDKPLRGQNYACVSFISPEDVQTEKEVFCFSSFIQRFAADMEKLFQGLEARYPGDAATVKSLREAHAYMTDSTELREQFRYYKATEGQHLEAAFHELKEFRTTMRGIKIRGVFDTLKEAQVRAEVLKRMGDKFDIFVCQVGVWCPWSPNPEELADQQYGETQINTLMGEYKKNMSLRDEFFEKRRQEKVDDALKETDAWTQRKQAEAAEQDKATAAADQPSTSA